MNDLISKSEVYKLFNNGCGIEKIHVAQIDDIPTVEAEPVRHGHWIEVRSNGKCSECGAQYEGATYNYCPYCGAKMDEEKTP